MTLEAAILKNVEKLPDSAKQSVLLYTEFLASQYAEEKSKVEISSSKKRRSGILTGTFVLPLPNDFDEPLEDFKEYME